MGKMFKIIIAAVLVLAVVIIAFSAIERNQEGKYVIVQSMSGNVKVVNDPVFYWALGAKTWSYPESFEIYLSKSSQDGGDGADTQAVTVTFNDKAIAAVSSVTKVLIPRNDDIRLQLHREFRSADAVKRFARSYIESILKMSGAFYKGAAAYSTERPAFEATIKSQLIDGKYATAVEYEEEPTGEEDEDGNPVVVKTPVTVVKRDENGMPIVEDEGFFNFYGLNIRSFQLKSVDPDAKTLARIEAEKDIEQARRIAKADAETAKQNAITAAEKGKAAVAQAKAEQEVIKERAVIAAEKEEEVAVINARREREVAKLEKEAQAERAEAQLIQERAEAEANKLKVQAGLTPQQEAEWRYKTTVDTAKAFSEGIARANYPDVFVNGGGEDGSGQVDFVSMLGIKAAMDLANSTNTK